MDRQKKLRTPVRAAITRTVNEVENLLAAEEPEEVELRVRLTVLDQLLVQIINHDEKVMDHLVDTGTEEEIEEEYKSSQEYKTKIEKAKVLINKFLGGASSSSSPTRFSSAASSPDGSVVRKRKTYKLPKIEIKKFDGDIKNWLGFWAQFKKIHEDTDLETSDKFQYLVQSIVDGSRAKSLVDSYPQTAENYEKVVAALTDRFGDKVILTEVYVRELLKLVINNVHGSKTGITLGDMYDKVESHLRALESLGTTSDQAAAFLYPLVESSLPEEIIKVWQRSPLSGYGTGTQTTVDQRLKSLMEFLKAEVKGAERLQFVKQSLSGHASTKSKYRKSSSVSEEEVPTVAGLHISDRSQCIFCQKSHDSKDCWKAQQMNLGDRKIAIQKKFLSARSEKSKKPANASEGDQTQNVSLACSNVTLLQTLVVTVAGRSGNKNIRVLLDIGSHQSYVSQNLVNELNLEVIGEQDIQHTLFGEVRTPSQSYKKVQVKMIGNNNRYSLEAFVKDKICGEIPRAQEGPWMKILKNNRIWISDIGPDCPEIQLLIGAKDLAKLYTGKQLQLQSGLIAIETSLGWTVMGQNPNVSEVDSFGMSVMLNMHVANATIEQLWSLDTIGIRDPCESQLQEEKEKMVKDHFLKTVVRGTDGRYCVSLPWTDGRQKIPDGYSTAIKRLEGTTKKLVNAKLFNEYEGIFNSWLEENIIEVVPESEIGNTGYYLPHRAVVKLESQTTPVRPVFDGSSKTGRSPSLNECLEKGPNYLDLIPSILLRFREGKIGVISDIRKAFLMVEVAEADRDYLRFLWWENYEQNKYKVLRHRRVVFGVNCSPFLLAAVIDHHLDNVDLSQKSVANKLRKSLYVDNAVASVNSYEELEQFKDQATEIMADAKMDLRLWQWSPGEVTGIGQSISEGCGLDTDRTLLSTKASVLGLTWYLKEDTLGCSTIVKELPEVITKRILLAWAHKIFDPIGFLCPVTIIPTKLVQQTWSLKLGWDEEVTAEIIEPFKKWFRELPYLELITIPRNFNGGQINRKNWQIHTFVDASSSMYAAVVFLRTETNEEVKVQLLQAKARVAPTKRITIPRLELLSCVIGARLAGNVKEALELNGLPEFYWTDSSAALAWINRNDSWGTFVGNRVQGILNLTKSKDWRHVPGTINPADLPSRGCNARQLLSSRWWEGPEWLQGPCTSWPSGSLEFDEDVISTELKKGSNVVLISTTESEVPWYLSRYSSYFQNLRLVAWIRRFVNNARNSDVTTGQLKVKEIRSAEIVLLRLVQKESFNCKDKEICGIIVEREEETGLICVKSKLLYRSDSGSFRKPILIPSNHLLTEQLILSYHLLNGHAGVQLLMGILREKYWIIHTRRTIKKVISKCVNCVRYSSKKTEVPAAPLPSDRVNTSKVFEIVGVDLAGPLYVKKNKKAWIVLFTCAAYRCVHFELVKGLSTEEFLEAFSRFISRRGRPAVVYSDNGTNFVGSSNLFKAINWDNVQKQCGLKMIQWKFNPPSAAWWGGWWERIVRSLKEILRRMLKKCSLTFDKLRTTLCECEDYINRRPLTAISEDPDDLAPLTPAMFMYENPAVGFMDQEFLDASGFSKLYNKKKAVADELKMRFRKEYLSLLVQRKKEKPLKTLAVGDIVLVGDDNRKRWDWPLARILDLYSGADGCIRVAKVKTATGVLTRPIQRLYPLEISSPVDEGEKIISAVKVKKVSRKREEKISKDDNENPEPKEVVTRSGRLVKLPGRYGS